MGTAVTGEPDGFGVGESDGLGSVGETDKTGDKEGWFKSTILH